jgi:hypothetical protein
MPVTNVWAGEMVVHWKSTGGITLFPLKGAKSVAGATEGAIARVAGGTTRVPRANTASATAGRTFFFVINIASKD